MKARVAYLLKKFPRLSETFVLNEILGQEDLGRDLVVLSRRTPDDEPRHPELARLRAPVEVLPPSRELDPWTTLFAEQWADPTGLLNRVGDLVRHARSWGHARFPSLLAEALYLLRRAEALGIAHVHAHFATDSAFVALLLRELGGPTYSVTAHAKDIYRSTVDDRILERIVEGSEFVVTVCDANVRELEGRLSDRAGARIRRLYNGVDLGSYAPCFEGREEGHVLAVGRLVEKKGFAVLLDSLRILAERGTPFRASIVGDGEDAALLAQRVRELELEDRVSLLGPRNQEEIRALMARATVLCQPCLVGADGNRDALPTVLLEALASGLPAISTPVTGIPEILDDGRVGVLVPERSPLATARAIEDLLATPPRREELAREGRAHAERLFDRDAAASTLFGWFEEVLQDRGAACASSA